MNWPLLLIMFWFLALGCQRAEKQGQTSPDINELADIYVDNMFRFYPEWGTFQGIEIADHSGLSDNSLAGLIAEEQSEDSLFAAIQNLSIDDLSKDDLITYSILKNSIESSINSRVCKYHLWTINHLNGFHIWFRYIADRQPIGDSISRRNAIARWKKIPKYIRKDVENNRMGLESGYALPKVVIEKVIDQLEKLISGPINSNPFFLPALRDSSVEFEGAIKKVVLNEIMPEVKRYKNFLKNEYLPRARPELSIQSIPNGAACYEASLHSSTSIKVDPEVIFQWGEEAIAKQERKILQIGEMIYGETEIQPIQDAFENDPSNYFTSKEEILAAAHSAISRAKNKVPDFFGLIPEAEVVLEPISELEEKTGFSRYLPASDDGTRPATYIQQTYMPETKTRGEIESTAFHETYPGHHLQISLSRELVQSHPINKYVGSSGFSEGWARYAESLANEMGLYTSAKSSLAMAMRLPTGMVVDPGIHFKAWTREEAIQYALQKRPYITRADAERYVDRIAVWPGQMTTYGVGEMYFLKLRNKAEEELGSKFNVRDFHDQCLKHGTVPLEFVDIQVSQWIDSLKYEHAL